MQSLECLSQRTGPGGKSMDAITTDVIIKNVSSDEYSSGSVVYNGSVTALSSGGQAPYIYTLSGYSPQNNGYFTLLSSGTYQLSIVDFAGNSFDTTIAIKSTYPLPSVHLNNIQKPLSCSSVASDGAFSAVGSGGMEPYLFSIDGGVNFTSSNTFTNLTPGNYNCILKDANGLFAVAQIVSYQYYYDSLLFDCNCCSFYATAGGNPSVCSTNTGIIGMNATGGQGPYSFSIDGLNYFPGTSSDGGYNFNGLGPGLYKVYAKDAAGNISVASASVQSTCSLTILWESVEASCHQSDGSVTLHAANGTRPYVFTIDGIHYQTDSIFNGLRSGKYNFSVRDANGKESPALASVVNRCPVVSATSKADSCNQGKGSIDASGENGSPPYTFSLDNQLSVTASHFSNIKAGQHTIEIEDANGFTSKTVVGVANNCLDLTASVLDASCSRENGSITLNAIGGIAPLQYSIDGIHFQSSNNFNALPAEDYIAEIKDASGASKSINVTVNDIKAPQINVTVTPASCKNLAGSIAIQATGGTSPILYSIDNGITEQSQGLFSNLDSARYPILITDGNDCIVRDTVQLSAMPTPKFSLGNDTTLCVGNSVTLNGPAGDAFVYQWQDNSSNSTYRVISPGTYFLSATNAFNCTGIDTIIVSFKYSPEVNLGNDTSICTGRTLVLYSSNTNGDYLWSDGSNEQILSVIRAGWYWLKVSDNGCSITDSILVSAKPSPVINLGRDTVLCEGQQLLLDVTNPNAIYLWQDKSTDPRYTITATGKYAVTVNENGCDTTGTISIVYAKKPTINIGNDTTICITQQLKLNAYFPYTNYEWQDGSTGSSFTVNKEGIYRVSAKNNCGITIDSISVKYMDCDCKWDVPNVFTPNQDGRNDVFHLKSKCIFSSYQLQVFDRWGKRVFTSQTIHENWDGTYKSLPQPTGVYVWMIAYKDELTGKTEKQSGTVLLIR